MIFLKKTECVGCVCVCVLHGTFKILVDYFTLGPTSKGFVSPLGIKSRIFWLLGKCCCCVLVMIQIVAWSVFVNYSTSDKNSKF